ncbi:hypothetical protein ACO0LB_16340 [Undibacterium sp. SXout7W]|uniref:hypothetical protein n=1 Tax=Undibacterium sp. SXout7W TaxID=3413049 RepID=UPI003BF3A247
MNIHIKMATVVFGFILSSVETPSWAQNVTAPKQTLINIGGHVVPVVAGGLYDRFRSNPPLSVIASEAPDVDLSWFKSIKKEKVDIGFESYSPNFY